MAATAEGILCLTSMDTALAAYLADRLREMDFGPYEGWSEAELEADPVAATRRRDGAQIPGVEPENPVLPVTAIILAVALPWYVARMD